MDNVLAKANELRTSIDDLPEVKEYLKLKKLYEENEELARLRSEIARLESENKLEEKKNHQELYNSHPLVNNFNIAKEEVRKILQLVKDILSE